MINIIVVILCLSVISCEKSVVLPNGYKIAPRNETSVLIAENDQEVLNGKSISQFCVYHNCIYGWIDDENEDFFFVNTKTKQTKIFNQWKDLDDYLMALGLPKLTMKDSFTYLDLLTKTKKKTW